jgi:hypothetical protein
MISITPSGTARLSCLECGNGINGKGKQVPALTREHRSEAASVLARIGNEQTENLRFKSINLQNSMSEMAAHFAAFRANWPEIGIRSP